MCQLITFNKYPYCVSIYIFETDREWNSRRCDKLLLDSSSGGSIKETQSKLDFSTSYSKGNQTVKENKKSKSKRNKGDRASPLKNDNLGIKYDKI